MPTLKGRRFFFATQADLAPGLRAVEQVESVEFVARELRDDPAFTVFTALSSHPALGSTAADSIQTSPRYLIFRRGETAPLRAIPQHRGGVKYALEPTADCLTLICGGIHAPTGALLAGELQQPLNANHRTIEFFERVSRELLRRFTRVRLYWVGPEALARLRAGQRLVTISVNSPREYDLVEDRP